MSTIQEAFEGWVNNSHMVNKSTEPGHVGDYTHPWTAGAWEAWKELHSRAVPQPVVTSPRKG